MRRALLPLDPRASAQCSVMVYGRYQCHNRAEGRLSKELHAALIQLGANLLPEGYNVCAIHAEAIGQLLNKE